MTGTETKSTKSLFHEESGIKGGQEDAWNTVGKGRKGQRGKHILNMGNSAEKDDEYEWVKENAIVDSGTIDTVSALKHIEKGKLRPTEV